MSSYQQMGKGSTACRTGSGHSKKKQNNPLGWNDGLRAMWVLVVLGVTGVTFAAAICGSVLSSWFNIKIAAWYFLSVAIAFLVIFILFLIKLAMTDKTIEHEDHRDLNMMMSGVILYLSFGIVSMVILNHNDHMVQTIDNGDVPKYTDLVTTAPLAAIYGFWVAYWLAIMVANSVYFDKLFSCYISPKVLHYLDPDFNPYSRSE